MLQSVLIWLMMQVTPEVKLSGFAQGTTWHIRYEDAQQRVFQEQVDSIFLDVDRALSVYRTDSEISVFNELEDHQYRSGHFYPVLQKAYEIWQASGGAFDPTVKPLSEAYKKGRASGQPWNTRTDSLLQYVGMQYITFDKATVHKTKPGVRLDLDGIVQGYTVDVIAGFLDTKGISRYLVEAGGELRCKGSWEAGVEDPLHPGKNICRIRLKDAAMTTAGNYQEHYTAGGRTFGHIVHPQKGIIPADSLLSATIIAKDAITADGFDTPMLVLGFEAARQLLNSRRDLEGILIYRDYLGNAVLYATDGAAAAMVR